MAAESAESPRPQPICAIDPLSLIINEIILVTSAMRKSARWASSGVAAILGGSVKGDEEDEGLAVRWGLRRGKRASQSAENSLMAEFSKLRGELADCKGLFFRPSCFFRSALMV
jgi:golgi-specific brefeldin A-resistance guanine nucleotide exchange factor 1